MKRHQPFSEITVLSIVFLFCFTYSNYAQDLAASRDMVFVLDNSDSMKTNDPEFLVSKTVSEFLDHLSVDSRVGIVSFDESPNLAIPLISVTEEDLQGKVAKALREPESFGSEIMDTVTIRKGDTLWDLADKYYGNPFLWEIIRDANNFSGSGDSVPVGTVIHIPARRGDENGINSDGKERTNIPAAVERAIYELKQNGRQDARKLIVLITDGHTFVEDSAREVEKYRWLKDELAAACKDASIKIFGITFSDLADFELIQTLAQKTNGEYYRIYKAEDIPEVVSSISEAASKPDEVTQSQPLPKELMPAKKGKRFSWMPLILALGGGLLVLGAFTFAYISKGREKTTEKIPEACLVDINGITDMKTYTISKKVTTIGRLPGDKVDIAIDKSTVSALHAQIRYKDRRFRLVDLDSTNGTYVNDSSEPLTGEFRLKNNDVIAFDQYKFKFLMRGNSRRARLVQEVEKTGKQENEKGREGVVNVPQRSATVISRRADVVEKKEENMVVPKAYLVDVDGSTGKELHEISKGVVKIGRAKTAGVDILIDKSTISSEHAQIEFRDNAFYLSDLGSRNGTFLNERKAKLTNAVRLNNDDIIFIDQYRFKFVIPDANEL